VSVCAGSQFFGGAEPIFLWRSLRTASSLPQLVSEGGDIIVSEGGDTMSNHSRLSVPMSLLGVFEGLPRMLVPGLAILVSLRRGDTMRMRGRVV
jgi:hypothetical protein